MTRIVFDLNKYIPGTPVSLANIPNFEDILHKNHYFAYFDIFEGHIAP